MFDCFINISYICCIDMKRSSLPKSVNYGRKKFYRSDTTCDICQRMQSPFELSNLASHWTWDLKQLYLCFQLIGTIHGSLMKGKALYS